MITSKECINCCFFFQNVTYPAILLDRNIMRYDSEAIGSKCIRVLLPQNLSSGTVQSSRAQIATGVRWIPDFLYSKVRGALLSKQYTTISYLSVQQSFLCNSQNYHLQGTVDDPMNCCPRPKAEGNSSSGHPQYRGGDNLTVAQKDLK